MKYVSSLTNKNSTHRRLLCKIPTGSVLLDVGCAQGYLAKYAVENLKCTVYGIELEEVAGKQAKSWCQDVRIGDIEVMDDKQFWNIKFDCILLGDILEHLKEPEKVLLKLSKHLSPSGRMIISLPNIAYLPVRLKLLLGKFDYTPTGIMDATHLRFFTRCSMNKMFESCGFDIVFQNGVGHLSVGFGEIGNALDQLFPTLTAVQFISVLSKRN